MKDMLSMKEIIQRAVLRIPKVIEMQFLFLLLFALTC